MEVPRLNLKNSVCVVQKDNTVPMIFGNKPTRVIQIQNQKYFAKKGSDLEVTTTVQRKTDHTMYL